MRQHIRKKIVRPYRSLPFFNQLPIREQEVLLRMGTELIVPPRTVVASSADRSRQCTLLLTGTFTWSEPDLSGGFVPTRRLGAGDFIDEEALSWACSSEDGPGAFWVHASTESRVLVYHRPEFEALVRQAPKACSLAQACTSIHLSAWEPRAVRRLPDLDLADQGNARRASKGIVGMGALGEPWTAFTHLLGGFASMVPAALPAYPNLDTDPKRRAGG